MPLLITLMKHRVKESEHKESQGQQRVFHLPFALSRRLQPFIEASYLVPSGFRSRRSTHTLVGRESDWCSQVGEQHTSCITRLIVSQARG